MPIPPTNIKPWKTISSEDISPSKFMPLRRDIVELADGRQQDFYIINIKQAAMVFPVTKDGKLVLIRQYKHGAGKIIVEAPAGMVDSGEEPRRCAVRELDEETGIKYAEEDLIDLGMHFQSPTKSAHTLFGFLALNAEFNSAQHVEGDENIEVFTLTPDEAIEMIKTGEIDAADTVAFILKIKLLHPELFNA